MDLESLEGLLGVSLASCGKTEIIPAEKWHLVNEILDTGGTTRLMLAASSGALDCVELLLRCGANVDAQDRRGRMAIDHGIDNDRPDVVLLLLQFDSILPDRAEKGRQAILKGMMERSDALGEFFRERDDFHECLSNGMTPETLQDILKRSEEDHVVRRRWVSSGGASALRTAGERANHHAWAVLRASGFACATGEEREEMEALEDDEALRFAIGRHFVELDGCHVQKMVAKSRAYGAGGGRCGGTVRGLLRHIDGEEYSSEILRCLQDDPSLEIVFDFSATDVRCMHPMGGRGRIWGLTDFEANRIYVAAKETEEFRYPDVVSNLVHELAHKALAVAFENGGLPYRNGDSEAREEYEGIVRNVSFGEGKVGYDKIIRRAVNNPGSVAYELIVRVPEMVIRYNGEVNGNSALENGFSRLRRQAPDLLEFYGRSVMREMREYVGRNKTANRTVRSELLRTAHLLTSHCSDKIQVLDSIEKARASKHNQLRIFQASNLKLGASHLKLSLEGLTFVDWSKFKAARSYFFTAMKRNEIGTLAIVWDEQAKPYICSSSRCRSAKCVAQNIEKIAHGVIMLVPSKYSVVAHEVNSVDYSWKDLSGRTKNWVLTKKVNFCGEWRKIKDVLLGCVGGDEAGVGVVVGDLLDAGDISMVIDQRNVHVGRPLNSILKERGAELLRSHPECYVDRRLRLRPVKFDRQFFGSRKRDVFFVANAETRDVERAGIEGARVWDELTAPGDVRCFTSNDPQWEEDGAFREMFKKLKSSPNRGTDGKRRWDFVHFFRLNDNAYTHVCSSSFREGLEPCDDGGAFNYSGVGLVGFGDVDSNEAAIIADVPGSGKSAFVNHTALQVRKISPECWIDVVELPLFEDVLKGWTDIDFASEEKAVDCLYELIKTGGSGLERKLFDRFCKTKMKTVVFFDGFDEICPDYKTTFSSFLQALVSGTEVKVCVTTRTQETAALEECLATVAYCFVPFDREEQVRFVDSEWNASIKSLPEGDRTKKVERIIQHLQSSENVNVGKELPDLIKSLKSLSGEKSDTKHLNFKHLAEEVLEFGKSAVEREGDLSETPLHCWMLSYVAFEENFRFKKFLRLSQLYRRFVEIKIDLYSSEKAKVSGSVATQSVLAGFKSSAYETLKKFSAFFFLKDEAYELKEREKGDMLRVGFLVDRGNSVTFAHRTFAEYLFSVWLLEKAGKKRVARVWVSQVLVAERYERVRQFINGMLQSGREEMAVDSEMVPRLNFSAVGEDFEESVQRCTFSCILECHEGILHHLAESSGVHLAKVLFGEARWDIGSLDAAVAGGERSGTLNAFTFCGECILGRVEAKNSTLSKMERLRFLPNLLELTEEHALLGHLNRLISEEGLQWTGVGECGLWAEQEGRERFRALFGFLLEHRSVLGEALRAKVLGEDGAALFVLLAVYAFDLLVCTLEAIVEDFARLLLEQDNFARAWIGVARCLGAGELRRVWGYVEGKLGTGEKAREFLLRKDRDGWNVLFASLMNHADPDVVPFVWGLFRREFEAGECKELIFQTLAGVKGDYSRFYRLNPGGVFAWLLGLLDEGYLDGDEVTRALLSVDAGDKCHLLISQPWHPPASLHKLQDLLLSDGLDPTDALSRLEGHYENLAGACFSDCEGIESDARLGECEGALPSRESFPLAEAIRSDGDGRLTHVLRGNGAKIPAVQLKSFVALLGRQIELEERVLGRGELLGRLRGVWRRVYSSLPRFASPGHVAGASRGFLLPYFFAVLSKGLRAEGVAGMLLFEDNEETALCAALREGDSGAFLVLYDVARWSMGEEALWRVHATGSGTGRCEKSVLQSLLCIQEEGGFECSKDNSRTSQGGQMVSRGTSGLRLLLKIIQMWTQRQQDSQLHQQDSVLQQQDSQLQEQDSQLHQQDS